MKIREYMPQDAQATIDLFYDTVHQINRRDYTQEQIEVWASKDRSIDQWNQSLLAHYSLVVEKDGQIIGFGDIDETGYLDRFYIHYQFQRVGAGRLLLAALEAYTCKDIVTHASITAKPFFMKMGYEVKHSQIVERSGVQMENYVMIKKKSVNKK